MNCRLRSVVSVFIITTWMCTVVARAFAAAADKPAKDEPTPAAAAPDKTAKDEPAPAATAKSAKEEPAPAAKQAKDEPAQPAPAAKPAKEEPAPAAAPATPPAPTYTVKREPFKIQIELDGSFECRDMSEIIFHPEEWAAFTVVHAVEHGSRVKKGDVLVEFDSEKIDKAIADLKTEQQIAEVALKLAEDQLATLEKSTPMDLETSQRSQRIAEEDDKRYFDDVRPMEIKTEDMTVKMYQEQLDNAKEELDQLEKMYKADDLTEETEKIVLKRARNTVERDAFWLEREQFDYDQTMKYMLPRTDEQIKENLHAGTWPGARIAWNFPWPWNGSAWTSPGKRCKSPARRSG